MARDDNCSKTGTESRFRSRWGSGRTNNHELSPRRRPEFMRSLGLLPPYTTGDVKQAYLSRAKVAHPDVGGDVVKFRRLHEDFERAIEYVEHRGSRLPWIASQVDGYAVQQEMTAEIRKFRGTVELEGIDWLIGSYGEDFAQLAEKIVGIQLRGPRFGDEMLTFLAGRKALLHGLRKLDLGFSRVTDEGLQLLHAFPNLRRLSVQGTQITNFGLNALRLPVLEWLDIQGTLITWWGLTKLRWHRPDLAVVTPDGQFKRNRTERPDRARGNGVLEKDGHAALLAKIAELRSRRH